MKTLTLAGMLAAAALALPVWAGSSTGTSPQADRSNSIGQHEQTDGRIAWDRTLYGRRAAAQAFHNGRFHRAARQFRLAAKYGDKLSQLSLGLMYLNGNGVNKNPATAWAWLALASTNNTQSYVATRDRVWAKLSPKQQAQAKKQLAALQPTFSDQVTGQRLQGLRLRAVAAYRRPLWSSTLYSTDPIGSNDEMFHPSRPASQ